MRIFTLLMLLSFQQSLFGQDTLRALFIGNSYMAVNNLPDLVQQLAHAQGDELIYDSNTPGGATFQVQANSAINYQKMYAQFWDYVIIQGQSQEPSFPFDQVNAQSLPYAQQLADSVHQILPCAQLTYYMTWGRQNGDPQWDSINTFDKMNARLRAAYLRIADSTHASVSPVAVAWKYVRDNYPSINLYAQDGSHPSLEGSYLAACVFYTSLFHKSCVASTFNPGIGHGDAFTMQQVATAIVLDSLPIWKLIHPDSLLQVSASYSSVPGASLQSFSATATQPATFTWYFPDMSIEVGPTVGYASNLSSYDVLLITQSNCATDSLVIHVTNTGAGLSETNLLDWKFTGTQQLEVFATAFQQLMAYDLNGKQLDLQTEVGSDAIKISYPSATAFIRIVRNNEVHTIRIPALGF
ncbi:MAG: hypothetical protein RLZZ301_1766 [Bacteroidota bacterium]|jgi:hypothetical protein